MVVIASNIFRMLCMQLLFYGKSQLISIQQQVELPRQFYKTCSLRKDFVDFLQAT